MVLQNSLTFVTCSKDAYMTRTLSDNNYIYVSQKKWYCIVLFKPVRLPPRHFYLHCLISDGSSQNKNQFKNCWRLHLLFLLNCLLMLYMSYYCLCVISHPLHVSTFCCWLSMFQRFAVDLWKLINHYIYMY